VNHSIFSNCVSTEVGSRCQKC